MYHFMQKRTIFILNVHIRNHFLRLFIMYFLFCSKCMIILRYFYKRTEFK